MAFTERYVSVDGAGDRNGTTEGHAWTLADMISAAPGTGVRVNIKAGSYSAGTTTWSGGAAAAPVVYRGYSATIGDLDGATRTAAGPLDTTGFPVITCTGVHTIGAFSVFQNLSVTGAVNGYLMGSATNDNIAFVNVKVLNTNASSSARAISIDDGLTLINCDMECSGAGHGIVVTGDLRVHAVNTRFKGVSTSALLDVEGNSVIESCVFNGMGKSSGNIGISVGAAGWVAVTNSTFYNLTTVISLPNAANTTFTTLINNHVTDCGEYVNSAYSGTATVSVINAHSRTRDNTTEATGIEQVKIREITTDTGGAETDFVDASTGDFRLRGTAPGQAAGIQANRDIGATQRAKPTVVA
jgi:hypothetical protein